MTSLLQLPDEILSLVATCCDCLSLKQLRLCCKRLSRISEQPLFQSLTVSTRHDEKLRLVRQHPTIANQVKSIVWDFQNDGREDAVDDQAMPDPQNAATKMESVFKSFPNLYRMGQKNTFSEPANFLNWCTTTLRARSHAISIFRAFQEESQLSELEICTPWSTFADPNESLGPLARAFRTLLLRPEGAAIDCQLKDCLDDVVFTRTFTQLNKLTLALDVPCPEAEAIELTLEGRVVNEVETYRLQGAYARLGRLLNNQRKLKVLHVRFRPRRPWARGLASHPLMSDYTLFPPYLFGSNSFYPRLSSLTIAGYLTNAESWLKFLRKASHTLRYLHLENIGLMTPAEVSTAIITALTLPVNGPTTITSPAQSTRDTLLRTACWVAVLTEMRQILRLKQISLNGDFVSLYQRWSVRDEASAHGNFMLRRANHEHIDQMLELVPPEKKHQVVGCSSGEQVKPIYYDHEGCLKTRVERWFINGGDFPLASECAATPVTSELPTSVGDYSWEVSQRITRLRSTVQA